MRLPLAVNLTSRDGTLTKDGLLTNAYVDLKSKEQALVVRRPGLQSIVDLGSGVGQGITSFVDANDNEQLFAVQNSAVYSGAAYTMNTTFSAATNPEISSASAADGARFSFGGYLWMAGSASNMAVTGDKIWYSSNYGATWTLVKNLAWGAATYRGSQTPVVVNRTVWLFGGRDGSGTRLAEAWYSNNGIDWTLGTAAAGFGACKWPRVVYLAGTFYFLGGQTGDNSAFNTWTNSIYSSADGINWSLVTTTPSWGGTTDGTRREGYGVCIAQGKMWVVAGYTRSGSTTTYLNDVWYSTDGSSWTQATASAAFSARAIGAVINLGGLMMVWSGNAGSAPSNAYYSADGVTWTSLGSVDPATTLNSPSFGVSIAHKNRIIDFSAGPYYSGAPTQSSASIGNVSAVDNDVADFSRTYDGSSIMIRLSGSAYKLTTADGSLTQITDSNYPTRTVRGNPYLNGYFYVMEPDGTIWNSAEDDCTSWAGTDFVSAEVEADGGVCLAKAGSNIVAFGKYTTEFFWDAGNATGSPLNPVEGGTLLIGCSAANSVAQVEDSVIWIAQRKAQGSAFQKGRFIAMLRGQSYIEVSTPSVNRVLDTDDMQAVQSVILTVAGHGFYVLTLGTIGVTLVYDLTSQMWYRWTRCTTGSPISISTLTQAGGTATATSGSAHGLSDGDPVTVAGATPSGYNGAINVNVTSSTTFTYPVSSSLSTPAIGTITATPVTESTFAMVSSCNFNNEQVVQEANGGEIFTITENVGQDDSVLINLKVRLDKFDGGSDLRKFMPWLEVIGDKLSSSTNVLVRYSDDDYQSWSYFRRADLSLERTRLNRLGSFRRRAMELRYTATSDLRLEAIEAQIDGGTT